MAEQFDKFPTPPQSGELLPATRDDVYDAMAVV
jgi:hypothetical protein